MQETEEESPPLASPYPAAILVAISIVYGKGFPYFRSFLIMAAPRSAIIMITPSGFPVGGEGMTDASITLRPEIDKHIVSCAFFIFKLSTPLWHLMLMS